MKSVNRTFRLDGDLLKTVHDLARKKNVSMNEFVADALRQAAADALTEGMEMEEVPGTWLQKLVDYVPPEKVAELGRWTAANFSRKFVWDTFKEVSPDALIRAYEILGEKYKSFLSFEHWKEGSEHILKFSHSRGEKWSIFYAENVRSAFKELLGIELEIERAPSMVRARFTELDTSMVKKRPLPQIAE